MKILYLCPDLGIPVLGRKGAAVHVRALAEAFARGGHEVVLAAQMLNKSPWEAAAEFGPKVLQIRPALAAGAAVLAFKEFNELLGVENSIPGELRRILYNKELEGELVRRFENDPPDLIYERASLYATAGISVARTLGIPLILELNAPLALEQATYRETGFGPLAREAERWTLAHADAVVVVSADLRKHVLDLGVAASRIHVMPNGVDPNLFHPAPADPAVRARFHLNGGPLIGFVGGLRPWHGIENLPELLRRLRGSHAAVQLAIAGDGPLRKDLERRLAENDLDEGVVITGLLPHVEIPSLIRQFDIAVAPYSPSDHGFYFSPLKLFEYMACGVPVVAPALGQIAQLVRDEQTGLLYPPGDMDSFTRCCDRLLANPELRQKLGQAAAEEVRRDFTWDHNAARVVDLVPKLPAKSRVGYGSPRG